MPIGGNLYTYSTSKGGDLYTYRGKSVCLTGAMLLI